MYHAWHLGGLQKRQSLPSYLNSKNFQEPRGRYITGQGGDLSGPWGPLSVHAQRQAALLSGGELGRPSADGGDSAKLKFVEPSSNSGVI